jgi:hypothetical protein
MTEADWLACPDPQPMLECLRGKASDRKLRLFAVGCCWRIWHLLADDRSKRAVEKAEGYADGLVPHIEFAAAARAALAASEPDGDATSAEDAAAAACENAPTAVVYLAAHAQAGINADLAAQVGSHDTSSYERVYQVGYATECMRQSDLLRDIFGNPFHPLTVDPAWLTPNVTALAGAIYDERAFDRLPILADALEEAGCDNEDVLTHCRGPGPHVRGCWVVDQLTGRG